MPFELTREQLYDLVWSEPMQRLSKQIGISDVAIAKHCRRIGVPVPERGYWNKLQAGHTVTRTPLPERDLTTIRQVSMQGALPAELRARIKGEPGVNEGQDDDIDILTERLRKRLGKVTVPRDFSRTHSIIAGLLKKDDEYRQEALTKPYSWRKPQFDAPFERRRLLFLNGLFLGFQSIGASPSLRGEQARELGIHMGDASVDFELDRVGRRGDRQRRQEPAADKKDKLCLTVSGRAPPGICLQWQDQDGCPWKGSSRKSSSAWR
jgi:hypothetical protein